MPDDYTSTTQTTGAVEVGGSATGEIEFEGDRDWFAVTLEAGRIYRIDLEGSDSGGGTLRDPYLRGVYDSDGILLHRTTDDDSGHAYNSRVYFNAPETGTYYIAAGAYGGLGTYKLNVRELEDDYGRTLDAHGEIFVGVALQGEIDYATDHDWFEVQLEAATDYRVEMRGSESGGGTLRSPLLQGVYDSGGEDRVAGSLPVPAHSSSKQSSATFTVDQAETYYVSAAVWHSYEGTYTLLIEEVM